ncbi:MAG: cysteine desulfurase family protein [Bacillota bacterium]
MEEIYFDNSSTTKASKKVINAMTKTLKENYGNPSSLHRKGIEAEKILKKSRKKLANKLGVNTKEILFTSGGSEANNLAIKGIVESYNNRGKHLITTEIEHPSILNVFEYLEDKGFEVSYLRTNENGIISLEELKSKLKDDTILVSIMHVNNEIGSIQPIKKAAKIIKEKNPLCFFHVDAVQAFGKVYLAPNKWNIDLISLSAHKIHGPKGIGALYKKENIEITPQIWGGGQEKGIRSGTENIPAIAGFKAALADIKNLSENNPLNKKINKLKEYLLNTLTKNKEKLPNFKINTPKTSAPQIINLSFPGFRGEVIVHSLEREGIYVSTGSACHSRKKDKSNTLKAISLSDDLIKGTIRISLSEYNTKDEIDYFIEKLIEVLEFLDI